MKRIAKYFSIVLCSLCLLCIVLTLISHALSNYGNTALLFNILLPLAGFTSLLAYFSVPIILLFVLFYCIWGSVNTTKSKKEFTKDLLCSLLYFVACFVIFFAFVAVFISYIGI